ncbi:MAG: hypothetical protein JXD22_01315 [Sedimentisphaerales bacterium]|nr:hypothetical protein [Sedimentisphaerales bacterium]
MKKSESKPIVTMKLPGIGRFLPVLIQHRKFIITSTILVLLAMFCVLLILDPKYEVSTSVFIKFGREMTAPATVGNAVVMPASKRPEDITSEIEIMKNRHLWTELVNYFGEDYFFGEPVADTFFKKVKQKARRAYMTVRKTLGQALVTLGFRRELTNLERVVMTLQSSVEIEPIRKSDVIEIRMRTTDPDAGEEILAKFLELYQESHLKAHTTPKAKEFFQEESKSLLDRLRQSETTLANFKESHGIWSIPEQRNLLLNWAKEIRSQQVQMEVIVAGLDAEIAQLTAQAKLMPAEQLKTREDKRNPVREKLASILVDLEFEKQAQAKKFQEDNRTILDLQRQINDTSVALQSKPEYLVASTVMCQNEQLLKVQQILLTKTSEQASLQAQLVEGNKQLLIIQQELDKLESLGVESRRLDREIARLEIDYSLYTDNVEEARISEAMDLAKILNISVIAPPSSSLRPVSPSLKLCFIGAIIIGLGGSIALIFIIDGLRPAVRMRQDVMNILEVPVLARIPEDKKL